MEQDLLKLIESKKPGFSKGQKRIAAYISENYDKAAYMTAAKLGSLVDVSESTVVRFANVLGFEGYPELQQAMKAYIRTRLTSFQRVEITNKLIGDADILDKVLLSDIDKIKHTLELVDRKSFNAAVEKIVSARKIYVIGMRSASSLAGFLTFGFRMMFDNVRFVQTTSGSEIFEQLMDIGEEDVMLAISFPRYSKRIIDAVRYAKQAGADIVALTDGEGAPIAAHADQLLIAQSDMASFVDSLVAPLSIINAIIVAVAKEKGDELAQRLRRLENIWEEYDVYAGK
ncbi:MAG: MurR/RpiR family transcriptional regulator [Clostridia bacterium]|nr:MurR/RpiR family transcriptional regulator [Clostridia bacterium]